MGRFAVAGVISLSTFLVFCHAARIAPVPPQPTVPEAAAPSTVAVIQDAAAPPPSTPQVIPDDPRFKPIDAIVQTALDQNKMPGAVVVVGRHDEILFQKAYGSRSILPERTPMTVDTVFDLASLTKSVATSTSMMLLVDRKLVDLDQRASVYVPELANMAPFTVRQLLIHTSGLPAGTPMSQWSTDRAEVIRHISRLHLKAAPGAEFNYSDVGFVVLQEIIQRISGKSLDVFAAEEIFKPLGMRETTYLPPAELRARAAPTEQRDGGFMQGEVHDPRAFALGGVGGHAGVFSTARDLTRFARVFLDRGVYDDGKRLVADKTFELFLTRNETPKGGRALGWDVDSTYASHKGLQFSPKAFGHGGYTGTALWIDPEKDLFLLWLSNRVHPDGKGVVNPTIGEVATAAVQSAAVRTGIDVLRGEAFERLKGAKIALVTNASARASEGTSTIDVLRTAPNLTVSAIFTPEHGLTADKEGKIADSSYAGIPIFSLYGDRYSPSSSSLDGVDTIVFDLQDVGMRFYTYASTMKHAMKVASDRKLRFVVLDRPNPIGGLEVQGPVLAATEKSFVNHHPLPLRHGMTMGELALLFAEDENLLKPEIVKLVGWRRKDLYDRTGLPWTAPSPNLRSLVAVNLYPAVGMLESTNVTVGRGTDLPFEVIAAPWMDGETLAKKLALSLPGIAVEPVEVTPKSAVYVNKKCKGIRLKLVDPTRFEPVHTALLLASAIHEVHPTDWEMDKMDFMLRNKPALAALKAGKGLADIEAIWAADLAAFKVRRERFLLYK